MNSHHKIAARRVQFDFSKSPVHWIPNDGLSSHVFNGINLILPAGEFWFCRVFNKALPQITDQKLKDEVVGFVRQEAVHARSHIKGQDFLTDNDYDLDPWLSRVNYLFETLLGEAPFGIAALEKVKAMEQPWLLTRVGIVAAIEHFTGVIGQWALDNKSWENAGVDPAMADLFLWHLAEEVEHRSVAFDLHQHLIKNKVGFYLSRQAFMAIVFPIFIYLLAATAKSLIAQDNDPSLQKYKKQSLLRSILDFDLHAVKTKHIPSIRFLAKATLRWGHPNFNPEHEGNTQQALDYFAKSPAVNASKKIKNKTNPVFS